VPCRPAPSPCTPLTHPLPQFGALAVLPGVRGLRSHGAVAVANMIAHSSTIVEVRLDRNKIGSFGAEALAAAFKTNQSVQRLLMRRCAIGERGAVAFANHALANDNSLAFVDLSLNMIGHEGVVAMEVRRAQASTQAR